MHFELEEVICSCGSKSYYKNLQQYSEDGRWTTREERLKNPNIKLASCYPCVAVSDDTWYTCNGCNKDIDPQTAQAAFKRALNKAGYKSMMEVPIYEKIGIAVINPKGINAGSKNNKTGLK